MKGLLCHVCLQNGLWLRYFAVLMLRLFCEGCFYYLAGLLWLCLKGEGWNEWVIVKGGCEGRVGCIDRFDGCFYGVLCMNMALWLVCCS